MKWECKCLVTHFYSFVKYFLLGLNTELNLPIGSYSGNHSHSSRHKLKAMRLHFQTTKSRKSYWFNDIPEQLQILHPTSFFLFLPVWRRVTQKWVNRQGDQSESMVSAGGLALLSQCYLLHHGWVHLPIHICQYYGTHPRLPLCCYLTVPTFTAETEYTHWSFLCCCPSAAWA